MRGLVTFLILVFVCGVSPVYSQDGTQLRGPKGADYGTRAQTFGPIKPTDTLWRIAAKVRPDSSLSIYQVMLALYEKNPGSFLEQNLNHMRDGAYLTIPSIEQMRSVNPQTARQRSEKDDEFWQNKTTPASTKTSSPRVDQTKQIPKVIKPAATTAETNQDKRIAQLQAELSASVKNVEEILVENNKLKAQLTNISTELDNLRQQLSQDNEIQQQLKELLTKQSEMIANQAPGRQQNEATVSAGLLSNPLMLVLLMTIPALLIVALLILLIKKRNTQEPATDSDDFLPQSPTYNADDDVNLSENFDPIIPDAIDNEQDDISIRIDDELEDDSLLENDDLLFEENQHEDSGLLDQSELDGLLSDDIIFDDEKSDADDVDTFLQQDFEQAENDYFDDEIDLDEEPTSNNDILSAADLDDLLESQDDDIDLDSLINEEEPNSTADDAIAGLETEDDLLDEEEFDLDDIDSLIDEVNETSSAVDDINTNNLEEGQAGQANISDDEDEFDLDDIDSLIDEVSGSGSAVDDINTNNLDEEQANQADVSDDEDEFDLDDIDSLIDEVNESGSPADDINTNNLDEGQANQADVSDDEDEFDLDDIDSLIDEVNESGSVDDTASGSDEELAQSISAIREDDLGEIDQTAKSDEHNTPLDEALADSADDLSGALDDLNADDIETLASSFADDDLDYELNTAKNDTEAGQSNESSKPKLDDTTPRSVDERLIDQFSEDDEQDYVETPNWSAIDDLDTGLSEHEDIDLGDDPLSDDTQELEPDATDELEAATSNDLDLKPQTEKLPEQMFGAGENDNEIASQTEQDLIKSLTNNSGDTVDYLQSDFDDEELIVDDLNKIEEPEKNVNDKDLEQEKTTNAQEQVLIDDTEKTNSDNELSDQQIDDDFMADLSQTDFDALLSELGEEDTFNGEDTSDFDVDFKALLNEDLTEQPEIDSNENSTTQDSSAQTSSSADEDFVDIDSLIEQSDDQGLNHEPYDDVDIDVGLSEFDTLLAGENPTDVDNESGGYSAKLDLARAYIEIDDMDAAFDIIEEVIIKGPDEVQQEALDLKSKLKN